WAGNEPSLGLAREPQERALLKGDHVWFGLKFPGALQDQNQHVEVWSHVLPDLLVGREHNNVRVQITCARLQLPNGSPRIGCRLCREFVCIGYYPRQRGGSTLGDANSVLTVIGRQSLPAVRAGKFALDRVVEVLRFVIVEQYQSIAYT